MDFAADWQDQHRQNDLFATAAVMVCMATFFVVLRLLSRCFLIRSPGVDDYVILGALVFDFGYLGALLVGRSNHMGFPMTMLSMDNMVAILKMTLSIEVVYYAAIYCIKTSILFTYLRFALTPSFRFLCQATIVLHCVFFFICFIIVLGQCRPLHKMWDLTREQPGQCIDTTAFFYFTSAFNILTDIWILALPIKTLRSIERPMREKVALFFIFGAGTFATIASIIRLHTIYTYTEAVDPFRNSLKVNIWSMIEINVAICCASVSALKPIFSRKQRERSRLAQSPSLSTERRRSTGSVRKLWHKRSGSSKVGSETWRAADLAQDQEKGEAQGIAAPRPTRPPPIPLSSRYENQFVSDTTDSSTSMMLFTPLSPRPQGMVGAENGLSSSGSMLVIQK